MIMEIHIRKNKPRKEPFAGERRTTKKHGEQIRVQEYSDVYKAWVVANGKPCYKWVCPEDLEPMYHQYLTKEEKRKYHNAID